MSGEWNGLNAHKRHFVRQEFDEDGETTKDHSFDKYYDVTDVKFDPKRPASVVSAGRDGFIRVQDINRKEPLGGSRIMEFWPGHNDGHHNTGHYPHTLLFRDSGPTTLAIGSTDGHVYVYNDSIWRDQFDPSICVKLDAAHGKAHNSGEMVWGRGNTLYVSSEPRDSENDHSGYHTAFDVSRPDAFTKFPDVRNSGDSLAIDSTGQNLALITRATAGVHTLRLYDVARQMGARASSKVALENFAFECDTSLHFASEVTSSSFSPDGRLLAIARNDDRLHVYDTRYLGKGPLLQFYHWGELREDAVTGWDNENAKILHYGITCARWVEGWYGHGLGIISGGGDGCVRLWDVMGSDTDPRNGEIIAEASWSIGRISLGDQSKGEKPLVVGDNGGRVYIYDHVSGSLEDAEP
ncbi:WD40-repeat-containing domain protein [Amylostereum chailletii]|nr:WD40-repeat-containing domain protein [Amylostereum chailletii]